jgi:metal-sulfur cluster biosynthetic enzyme
VPALEREQGPRLSDALEMEDRITPVVRRDPLARDDMKIALAVGIAQPDGHRLDPDSHRQLAGHGFQALRKARWRKLLDGFVELGRRELFGCDRPPHVRFSARPKMVCNHGYTGSMPTREEVIEALRIVEDPELGMDIVELGLLYDVAVDGSKVHVTYSLTSMGCPVGPMLEQQITEAVAEMPGVDDVESELTWDPPWTPEKMSDDAKFILGFG